MAYTESTAYHNAGFAVLCAIPEISVLLHERGAEITFGTVGKHRGDVASDDFAAQFQSMNNAFRHYASCATL